MITPLTRDYKRRKRVRERGGGVRKILGREREREKHKGTIGIEGHQIERTLD